jgi:hypothetical protein
LKLRFEPRHDGTPGVVGAQPDGCPCRGPAAPRRVLGRGPQLAQ